MQDPKLRDLAADTTLICISKDNMDMHERLCRIDRQLSTLLSCDHAETYRNPNTSSNIEDGCSARLFTATAQAERRCINRILLCASAFNN